MWVVKLGGSLFDHSDLPEWVKILSEYGAGKVVIVPGGGPFADQVRTAQKLWDFSDQQAHKMALHAMDQYGLMLIGIAEQYGYDLIAATSEKEIRKILVNHKTPVWLSAKHLEKNTEIPQNWTVTSDSLSAWLANELKAEKLFLIKRIEIQSNATLDELEKNNVVDSSFRSFVSGASFEVSIIGADKHRYMGEMLETDNPDGTCVS